MRVRAALALALLAAAAPSSARAATLDDAERTRAERLARTVPWVTSGETARGADGFAYAATPRSGHTRGAATPDAGHPLGVQTLVIERESGKGAPLGERRARVYQHDHDARRTRRVRLDLNTGAVLDVRTIASPHLPLNEDERRWALGRLAADASLLERLREEQRARGRTPFATLDALEVKAIVFESPDAAHPCHVERCALLSLFDATRTVFAVEPVVRFASGRVETLDGGEGR